MKKSKLRSLKASKAFKSPDTLMEHPLAVPAPPGAGGAISSTPHDGLALALSYMKEVEGWGGGVARYFTDWTAAGLPRPRLEETPGFFKVVFERKKMQSHEPVNEPVNQTILQAICRTPGMTRPALMRVVGKSRATVTRALSDLVGQGLIEHRGSAKTGGYFLAERKREGAHA